MFKSIAKTIALLIPVAAGAAEPILLPDFTPGTPDEFAITVMIQDMVTERLTQDGHILLTHQVVAPVVGDAAITHCAALPSCPQQVLPRLPTRIAVVARIHRTAGTLNGHFELYEQSNPQPVVVRDVPLTPGNEHLLAQEISIATANLVAQVGPSPDAVVMAAARLIAGHPSEAPQATPLPVVAKAPAPGTVPYGGMPGAPAGTPGAPAGMPGAPYGPGGVAPGTAPAPGAPYGPGGVAPGTAPVGSAPGAMQPGTQPAPMQPGGAQPAPLYPGQPLSPAAGAPTPIPRAGVRRPADPNAPIGFLLEGTGVKPRHLIGSEQNYRNSGLDARDWVYKAMPHAGRVTFEIRAGLGLGDVDRQADMRVEFVGAAQRDSWYQESPLQGRRPQGAIFIGYAPATMIDLGVVAGLQYGRRHFTTGFARYNQATDTVKEDYDVVYTAVDAVQLFLQPRVRGYLVPTGPAKPFLFTGADIRVFDAYDLEQPEGFTYLIPPAGVVPGWIGGGGMMIDPSPIVGFFFEGSYTQHFGERADTLQSGVWNYTTPPPSVPAVFTIGLTGGVQFRI